METSERDQMVAMFAGIALPGLIGKSGLYTDAEQIASEAFDIGEAMIKEMESRTIKQEEDAS